MMNIETEKIEIGILLVSESRLGFILNSIFQNLTFQFVHLFTSTASVPHMCLLKTY